MVKRLSEYDRRLRERRDALWADAPAVVWTTDTDPAGYCVVPRTLTLISTLINAISKTEPSRVYMDLWLRQRNDGLVEIDDAEEMAAAAGLRGTRARKSFREKLDELERLGFIRIKGGGVHRYKHILLLHPHDVVQQIRQVTPEKIPPGWWELFEGRLMEVGGALRSLPPLEAGGEDA